MDLRRLFALVGLVAAFGGCASPSGDDGAARTQHALTSTQARVLGFEAATTDWHAGAGTLAASATTSQGAQSLAVTPAGWTEITSIALDSLGNVNDELRVDVLIPSTPTWGEIRAILVAPSLQQWWTELGTQSLTGLTPGAFTPVSFPVPASVKTALSGTYQDLTIKLVINAETLSQPYLLDNIVMTAGGGSGGSGKSTGVELSVTSPVGVGLRDLFMSATDHLSILSQAQVGETGSHPALASFGDVATATYMQAEAKANANVYSVPSVQLDAKVRVVGFVHTQGSINKQGLGTADAPVVTGGEVTRTTITSTRTSWTVTWPAAKTGDVQLNAVNTPTDTRVAPGTYGAFNIHDRNRVYLWSGSYYFDSFNTEPQAEIHLDTSTGPIYIYVRSSFTYKGAFVQDAGELGQVLIGYVGSSDAFLQAPFLGTMVAPNATIRLERPTSGRHVGSFYGKSIEVAAGQHTVVHQSFNFSFNPSCPLGDTDNDGVFDCTDVCNRNPAKVLPGMCGCDKPETDTDGDRAPDCIDECPLDAEVQFRGACGCPSDPAPAGKSCSDGVCVGHFTCDGHGSCGDANACRPDASCKLRYLQSTRHYYWFCDAPMSWDEAATVCRSVKASRLVQIDSRVENAFVAANASATAPMWTGANDRTQSGEWVWAGYTSDNGDKFWTRGASGKAYFARFASWSDTAPSASSDACGRVDSKGAWTGASCSATSGFVCEVATERLEGYDWPVPLTYCQVKGTSCAYQGPGPNCVSEKDAFGGATEAEALDAMAKCQAACKDGKENTPECQAACGGPSTPPGADDTCDEGGIELTDSSCGASAIASPRKECTKTEECPSNTVCSREYEGGGEGQPRLCVIPSDSCAETPTLPTRCKVVDICEPQLEQTVTNATGEDADLSETQFDPRVAFGATQEAPSDPYWPDDNPCGGSCAGKGEAHPWCHLGPADSTPDPRDVDPNKAGRSDGSLISFNFDPKMKLNIDAEIGAFGLPKVKATAEAGFSANIEYSFAGGGTLHIIDVLAALDADECGMESREQLDIFGVDFIAKGVVNKGDYGLPIEEPAKADQAKCRKAFEGFQLAGDRAKKGLRDALLLLADYKTRVDNDKAGDSKTTDDNLPKDLCRKIVPQPPRGFPAGNCPAMGDTESPEDTINRFIEYYRRTVLGFGTPGIQGLSEAAAQLAQDAFGFDKSFSFYTYKNTTPETIATVQFFIGPVPCLLEVESTLDYGIEVGAYAKFNPGSVVDAIFRTTSGSSAEPVAYVEVHGTPYAGASLGVFAGAGFGVPGFKVRLGLQADLQLGTVYIPAYAGAGVGLGAEIDDRAAPADISPHTTGFNLIPAKRYVADLRYSAGLAAKIRNVLSGSISARLKISVLFFSASWRKTLLSFKGICPGSPDDEIAGCDFKLVSLDGSVSAESKAFPWAEIRMPTLFPELQALSSGAAATGSGSVPLDVVQEFFYDSLCTCIDGNNPEETRECFRSADCCDAKPACFNEPKSGKNICITCRSREETCNEDADCCGDRTLTKCNTATGQCEGLGGCHSSCGRDDECQEGLKCENGECYVNTRRCNVQ